MQDKMYLPMQPLQKLLNPKINILGMTTKIVLDDPSNCFLEPNAMGRWNSMANTIFINNTMCPEQQMATLYHEVTHAVLAAIGELDLSKNEDFVEKLSRAYLQIATLHIDSEHILTRDA